MTAQGNEDSGSEELIEQLMKMSLTELGSLFYHGQQYKKFIITLFCIHFDLNAQNGKD